jgi:hypothetical protein
MANPNAEKMTREAANTAQNVANRTVDMFEQATESFRATMDAGLKFQQDAMRSMFGAFSGTERMDDVRRRIESITNDSIGLIRKNVEQTQKLFDQNCRTGMDMMNRTFEAIRPNTGNADAVEQCRSAWKNGFDAMCSGIDAVAKTNVQVVENVASFLDRSLTMAEKNTSTTR